MEFKENKNKRYRLSNKIARLIGAKINKSKRYRLSKEQQDKLKEIQSNMKILIWDLETSRGLFSLFWTGKQYVPDSSMVKEPNIITVSYKWLGEDNTYVIVWDKDKTDEKLVKEFLSVYNKADMSITYNGDNFDVRWLNWRAMKYGYNINLFVKQFDIFKQSKRLFRLPSYSLNFLAKTLGVTVKVENSGKKMWDELEHGTKEEHDNALQEMCEYNIGDITTTEEVYVALRKYMGHKVHVGVMSGLHRFTCPNCGGYNIEYVNRTTTAQGTVQRIFKCLDDGVQYRVNNKVYMEYLEYKLEEL